MENLTHEQTALFINEMAKMTFKLYMKARHGNTKEHSDIKPHLNQLAGEALDIYIASYETCRKYFIDKQRNR